MISIDLAALPSAPEVEKSVLSTLCNYQYLFDEASHLTPEHFYSEDGRDVLFSILQDEWRNHQRIDVIALTLRLREEGRLDRVGGAFELSNLISYAPPPTNFKRHVQVLNEYKARRLAIHAALAIGKAAFSGLEIEELLQAAGGPITEVFEAAAAATAPKSTKSLIKASLQRYLDRSNGLITPDGYGTGIEDIDHALYGLLFPGRVIAVGAYPSGGKSVFGSQVLTYTAINGHPSLYIPLEMSEMDLIDRAIIQASGLDAMAWSDPKGYAQKNGKSGPTEAERRPLQRSAENLLQAKFEIRKPSNKRLQSVLATIRKGVREIGAKIVAVDFIQQIRVPEARGNKEQTMEEISHSLQEIAEELQICILVLSQLNADGDTKHGRVVEEDADAFLLINQEMNKQAKNFRQHQDILIVKDRHYGKGGLRLKLVLDREKIKFIHGDPIPIPAATFAPKANF